MRPAYKQTAAKCLKLILLYMQNIWNWIYLYLESRGHSKYVFTEAKCLSLWFQFCYSRNQYVKQIWWDPKQQWILLGKLAFALCYGISFLYLYLVSGPLWCRVVLKDSITNSWLQCDTEKGKARWKIGGGDCCCWSSALTLVWNSHLPVKAVCCRWHIKPLVESSRMNCAFRWKLAWMKPGWRVRRCLLPQTLILALSLLGRLSELVKCFCLLFCLPRKCWSWNSS